ncbi:hypothetical protein EAI_15109, partial [Harpegnathos saltator]
MHRTFGPLGMLYSWMENKNRIRVGQTDDCFDSIDASRALRSNVSSFVRPFVANHARNDAYEIIFTITFRKINRK